MIVNVFGEEVEGRSWINRQREKIMKKYKGMSLEEVEADQNMPKRHKERMISLLKLHVGYPKPFKETIEEELELFQEYINLSEENKKYFKETGKINSTAILDKNGEIINIGMMFTTERNFMSRYRGMTLKEIKNNQDIPNNHKIRMQMLLEFGITYAKEKTEERKEIESKLRKSIREYTETDLKLKLAKDLEGKYKDYTNGIDEEVEINE